MESYEIRRSLFLSIINGRQSDDTINFIQKNVQKDYFKITLP